MERVEEFLATARKLKTAGLVTEGVNKGSISCRLDAVRFLISPSKRSYDELDADSVNIMRLDGSFVRQNAPVSRDSYFHLAIYNARPDVNAIIHTHSKYAAALCLAGRGLPCLTVGMKFHCKGSVEMAPFALPNTEACTAYTLEYLRDKNAVLLRNHGLVCVNETLADCYETAEFIEGLSESYVHALQIGTVEEIDLGNAQLYQKK